VPGSPLQLHGATPKELVGRLAAERRGTPFLLYRDGRGRQVIVDLVDAPERLSVGRRAGNDLCLDWDESVSRVHATFEPVGRDWTLVDDGLSLHGTFDNGDRLGGRRRLADGDVILVGDTALAYVAPRDRVEVATNPRSFRTAPPALTPAQVRVLVALCRPFRDALYASPAGNRQIAEELVVSVDAVKARLRELFDAFGISDLPQNEKRAALALEALRRGVINPRDL
jgi:hypothetical protein